MGRLHGRNEWLSENAHRSFPLRCDQRMADTSGGVLPDSFLLDFRCVAVPFRPAGEYPDGDFAARLVYASGSVGRDGIARLRAGFRMGALDDEAVGGANGFEVSAEFDTSSRSHGDAYGRWMYNHEWGSVSYRALNIRCVLGVPPDVSGDPWYDGSYHLFDPGIEVIPSRCIVVPGGIGVDNLLMKRNVEYHLLDGRRAAGMAHVRDGRNTEFRVRNGELHLSVYPGAGDGAECPSGPSGGGFIRYINGQHAGSDGDFAIVGGEGVEVGTASYGSIPGISITTGSLVDGFAKPR